MVMKLTKGYRGALAAVACGAVLLSATPSASATMRASNDTAVNTISTPAQEEAAATKEQATAAERAAAAAQRAADRALRLAAAAQKAADAAVAREAKAAAKAEAAAKRAAEKAAKAAARAEAKAAREARAAAARAAKEARAAAAKAAREARAAAAQAAKEAREAAKTARIAAEAERRAQTERSVEAAKAIPGAPVDLAVHRSDRTLNDFEVTWGAPSGAVKHYIVTVYADGERSTYKVNKPGLTVTGRTLQTVYQIEVAARDKNGNGASAVVALAPAVPGAPAELSTSAVSAESGVTLAWQPPTRDGFYPIDSYRVSLVDQVSEAVLTQDTPGLSAVFAEADPTRNYEATVTAVTQGGDGLPMTVQIGSLTSTIPRGFTAIRDAHVPTEVNLAWSPPVWQAFDPLIGYEVGVGHSTGITWTDVGLTEAVTLPLALDQRSNYFIRAVNASGPSAADYVAVATGVKTQLPSSAAPVVLSTADRQVDVAFYGWVGTEADDHLIVTLTSPEGYRSEQVRPNQSDGVAFRDLPNATYTVTVIGLDTETGTQSPLFNQEITVNEKASSKSSVESSFDGGVGYWHGVYPGRHLPTVVSTKDVSFEGTGSMAITATWDSIKSNVTAGTSGRGGIPVRAKQPVTVSALGRPGAPSDWNMGISWWDAAGKQISLVRAKRVSGVVNAWRPSQSTYTAPAGAVSATAFIEVGGLRRGETFYVDGITLTSQ